MENWQSVMFVSMRNNTTLLQDVRAPAIYILWIFIGNFILLNLFLAILLDAFLEDDEGLSAEELEELRRKRIKKKLHKKMLQERKLVKMDIQELKALTRPAPSWVLFGEKPPSEEDLEDLDEEQIVGLLKEIKILKKGKEELARIKMYVGMECQSSFFVFSQENWFRSLCYKAIKHGMWETVVLTLISLSSFKLFYDTFFLEDKRVNLRSQISGYADDAFNYLFIIEMVTKLIAMGVVMDEGSYLRDTWNQMDFFIVTSSIADMALVGSDLKALKILRMLRTLRPLRFLTHNVGLKLIVNALIGSVGGIVNVMLVIGVVFLIFAIIGVNFYSGKFFFCNIDPYTLQTRQDCEYAGGSWELWDHNFDFTGRAFLSFFIVASLEGWPDIMI